ncbi:MAG: 4-(cytidine 5'-diphospho)-2-C-methyl-D-erythritol kinase [Proteobacteria bacterium]|nr:4-(cytidine 5'-diphospho)-2-C-methyl-D-erythritol kinase [Pseudomonadota bacterium]MCL2309516.1 4-(cytidine 5'-diphospho)-2-C-methyl-D-erythritol kinase [Pseudomonadota bacterium]
MITTAYRFPAPAKLNLFLHVTCRRADGYHNLESVFVLIDLADVVTLALRDDGVIARERDIPGVSEEADLTLRAARLLQEATGVALGVTLKVDKRIPLGGGLGGGSSDAATVLLALNRLWGTRLSRRELSALALRLGADVPFFLGGTAAFVSGIGEVLRPVSLPPMWIALAMPLVAVPTGDVFADPHLTRSTASETIAAFAKDHGRNDLEPVVAARYPEVATALAALRQATPTARMSGSGASAFGMFDDAGKAEAALRRLPPDIPGRLVRTVSRHPLVVWGFR